jgi:Myb-like DNA-binding domain
MTTRKIVGSKEGRPHSTVYSIDRICDPSSTITLLESTINANHTLQQTLQSELQSLTREIGQNRTKVNHLVHKLLQLNSTSNDAIKIGIVETNNASTKTGVGIYVPHKRRWTKRFFVDHKGSEPKPNVDTIRRREIEKQSFFYHTQPPWSSKESDTLMTIVQNVLNKTNKRHQDNGTAMVEDDSNTRESCDLEDEIIDSKSSSKSIDFDIVAGILNGNEDGIRKRNRRTTSFVPYHQRLSEECQIQYENEKKRKIGQEPFNEQTFLSNVVASTVSAVGASNIDWEKVAEDVSSIIQQQSQSIYRFTAWDCLVAYHTKLKTPLVQLQATTSTWTHEEDELLLKFIAAAGPQALLESKNTLIQSTLCTQLLLHKSKKQIFVRANQTLLNPNMQRTDWSDYEERRLPICMKIYYTPNPQDCHQLYRASTHCYGRSTKSVVDKWNRSINPAYSTKPFTKEEDEALLSVMRSALNVVDDTLTDLQKHPQHIGWTQLSQSYFPHRHPQRLQSRWSELATDTDIVNRERARLKLVTSGISNPTKTSSSRRHQLQQQKRPLT